MYYIITVTTENTRKENQALGPEHKKLYLSMTFMRISDKALELQMYIGIRSS